MRGTAWSRYGSVPETLERAGWLRMTIAYAPVIVNNPASDREEGRTMWRRTRISHFGASAVREDC